MSENPVHDRIQQEIDETPVVLYMKGTPGVPAVRLPRPPASRS